MAGFQIRDLVGCDISVQHWRNADRRWSGGRAAWNRHRISFGPLGIYHHRFRDCRSLVVDFQLCGHRHSRYFLTVILSFPKVHPLYCGKRTLVPRKSHKVHSLCFASNVHEYCVVLRDSDWRSIYCQFQRSLDHEKCGKTAVCAHSEAATERIYLQYRFSGGSLIFATYNHHDPQISRFRH
mgnify:CR=1 FL=1